MGNHLPRRSPNEFVPPYDAGGRINEPTLAAPATGSVAHELLGLYGWRKCNLAR